MSTRKVAIFQEDLDHRVLSRGNISFPGVITLNDLLADYPETYFLGTDEDNTEDFSYELDSSIVSEDVTLERPDSSVYVCTTSDWIGDRPQHRPHRDL